MSTFLEQLSEPTRKEFAKLGKRKGAIKLAQLLMPTIKAEYDRLVKERNKADKAIHDALLKHFTESLSGGQKIFKEVPALELTVSAYGGPKKDALDLRLELQVTPDEYAALGNLAELHKQCATAAAAVEQLSAYRYEDALVAYLIDAFETKNLDKGGNGHAELIAAGKNLLKQSKVLPAKSV